MGRGRKPAPTPLKIAAGNPGKHPINAAEPAPLASRLTIPKWLKADKVAADEYKRMGKKLLALGVMTELDETALTAYAKAYAQWVAESALLAEEGTLLKSPKGNQYTNPRLWVVNAARDAAMKILAEFGMTPSSRSKIKAMPSPNDGPGKGMLERTVTGADQSQVAVEARAWEPPGPTAHAQDVG
jgi:P27 family predicted phage terminase small subunit